MKTVKVMFICLALAVIFAVPAWARDICGKKTHDFNPGPGAYKQVTQKDAQGVKDHFRSDQHVISLKPDIPFKVPHERPTRGDVNAR